VSGVRSSGLAKTYGDTRALAGIDLNVPAGSVYGLVGPNGSGKTTALEILAGLRRPSAGEVELGVPAEAVAYCPDTPEFEPWLTALEVLDTASGLLGRPRARSALHGMLERVGLSEVADRRVAGFSRGMLSRLGLAAGLIGDPQLLLADEPAAALDPAGRVEILDLLAGLAGPVTVVISSHDLADVERVCHGIGILVRGRLVWQGAIGDLLAVASPVLRVVVRPPADRLRAALAASPWVRSVGEGGPGELMIEVADGDAAEVGLPRVLAGCGVRLIEVTHGGVSLEDVFFDVTGSHPSRHRTREES
jgi:ABC-2 type transport system ATP-binding protein